MSGHHDLALDREYKARLRARKALDGECLRCSLPALEDRSLCEAHLLEQRTQKRAAYRSGAAERRLNRNPELHAYHCSRCGGPGHNRIACEAPKRAGEGRR